MNLVHEDFSVVFAQASHTISFKGAMRLSSMRAYDVVRDFLQQAVAIVPPGGRLVIDVTALQFLNSSGITTLSIFVLAMRDEKRCKLAIRGSRSVAWQYKSLGNFKRLWNEVDLQVV